MWARIAVIVSMPFAVFAEALFHWAAWLAYSGPCFGFGLFAFSFPFLFPFPLRPFFQIHMGIGLPGRS